MSFAFTISSAKTFKVDHFIYTNGGSGQTLGVSSNASVTEIYTSVEIVKTA